MEEGCKAPPSMASGGQQRTHHPRPFFYVQPPSQPYYVPFQQWQMNNPYAHFAMPGGFNFGRPCLNPYQYMQYPGFVFPHAPLYPMDLRRMFEPRFPSPHWDTGRPQPPPHTPEHRETACSEAQTDPSDAIAKLIQHLDKMQVNHEARVGTDRELDSGVASQSSTVFSPKDERKSERQRVRQSHAGNESCLETPVSTFSTIAVYDGDSSRRSLEELIPPECHVKNNRDTSQLSVCWAGAAEEEELPLDTSSVQGDHTEKEEQVVPIKTSPNLSEVQTDSSGTDQSVPSCDEFQRPDRRVEQKCDDVDLQERASANVQEDPGFQILKLPFELASEAKGLSPLSQSPYYYLQAQSTHERMSVLSPSLDELSSRDELFSTDLEEVELFPRRVYAGSRRLAEVVRGSRDNLDEIWTIGSQRFMCACCGKSLPRGATTRSKVHCSKVYLDEGGDSDSEGRFGQSCEQPIRVVVRKHSAARKTHPLPPRLAKSWHRRGPTWDQAEQAESERTDSQGRDSQDGTCWERLCREEPASDQGRQTEGAVRRRATVPGQRPELPPRKLMYHRPKDEEDEQPPPHWDRGAMLREEL